MMKQYWKIRKYYKFVVFKVKSLIFTGKNAVDKLNREIPFKRKLFFEVLKQIIKNIILILMIVLIEEKTIEFAEWINQNNTKDLLLLDNLCAWMIRFNNSLIDNQNILFDLLIAIIGVAGVYLGLYCSNMMSIFSERYANAPQRIARLFENDILMNKCIRSITSYMIFVILMIFCNLIGVETALLAFIICIILGIRIIVSYGFMSRRTYQFSDTYYLANQLNIDIYNSFKLIKLNKLFSQDRNFQNHCRKMVINLMTTLQQMNDYCIEKLENKNASMEEFMTNNLMLINSYWNIKGLIEYDSYWYADKVVYKKWYSASDHEVNTAIYSGTNLGYTKEKDYYWFEDILFEINDKCLKALVEVQGAQAICVWMKKCNQIASKAIEASSVSYYLEYLHNLQDKIMHLLCDDNSTFSKEEEMALVEAVVNSYITIIIEIRQYVTNLNIENILSDLNINSFEKMIGENKFYNFYDVKKLYKGIEIEVKLERERITPNWYIKQTVAKHIYDELVGFYLVIDKIVNEYMAGLNNELLDKNMFSAAMIACAKINELKVRIEGTIQVLDELLNRLEELHIEETVLWCDNPNQQVKENMHACFKKLPAQWVRCSSAFTIQNWDSYDQYPDLLGACYNYLCEHLIVALTQRNYEEFGTYYVNLWSICILYQEVIRKDVIKIKEEYRQHAVFTAFSTPIVEYAYISGYAYILGEILGDIRWKTIVESSFDKGIQEIKNKNEYLEQMVSIFSLMNNRLPAIYNRDIIHSRWTRSIEYAFEQLDELEWKSDRFTQILVTKSPLLKAAIRYKDSHRLLRCEAYEVFAIMILNKYLSDEKKFCSAHKWEEYMNE